MTATSRTLPAPVAFGGVAAVFAAFFLAAGAPTPLLALRQSQWGFPDGLLTIAFAAYAVGLVIAVLTAGSLSDHLGRRPVLLASLTGELAAMVLFLAAPDIGWVVVARIVQGVATGLGTSAFTAAIVEHAPDRHKKLSSVIGGTAASGGLGLGALLTGAAVQFTSSANTIVFVTLATAMAAGLVLVAFTRETGTRRPGAVRSLTPRIAIPPAVRREFFGSVPVHLASWMLAGLFMGLSPTILRVIFDIHSGLANGATAFLAPGSAAVASLVFGALTARRATVSGVALVGVGTVLIGVAVIAGVLPLLWIGGIVGGAGFGASFAGSLRLVTPFIEPQQRAGVFAGVYTTAYLAFGIPAIIAGQLVGRIGLLDTVVGYAAVIVTGAVGGALVQLLLARAEQRSLAEVEPMPVADLRSA